jgi:outer membrane receptor protein involved in Fe transport
MANSHAEDVQSYTFDIPSLKVEEALSKLATRTTRQLLFSYKLVDSRVSTAVSGNYTAAEALDVLLEGTNLSGRITERGVIIIRSTPAENDSEKGEEMKATRKGIGTFLASIFVVSGAGGQETQSADGFAIEEIIVTAQKREQRVIDTPMSIKAIGGAEIRQRNLDALSDIAIAVPGLKLEDSGVGERHIILRGVANTSNPEGATPTIGLYLNEAPVSGSVRSQVDLRTYDLNRIEVLRGPQGTLYGQASMGGTIRFITNKPELDQFSGRLDAAVSFTEDGGTNRNIRGVANIPFKEDVFGLRIAAVIDQDAGWIDQPATDVLLSLDRDNINTQDLVNIRTEALWLPADNWRIEGMAVIHRNDAGASNQGEDENGNYTQALERATTPSFQDDHEVFSGTVSYDFSQATLMSITSYFHAMKVVREYGYRFPTVDPALAPPNHVLLGLNEGEGASYDFEDSSFTQELRLTSSGEDALSWTIGAFYQDLEIVRGGYRDSPGEFLFGLPPSDPNTFLFRIPRTAENTSTSISIFGNVGYALSDSLEIGVGVRYFENDREQFSGDLQKASFDSVDPRAYVSLDLSDNVKAYASVAKGFRSGGFNRAGIPPYDPESLWSYELGTKMNLVENRLSLELAVYYSEYSDYFVNGILPDNIAAGDIITNGGEAEIKGVDFTLNFNATDMLNIGLNANYVDAKFTEVKVLSSSHAVGDPLDGVPEYSFALWLDRDLVWGGKDGFVRIDYSQVGETYRINRSFGDWFSSQSDVIDMLNVMTEFQLTDDLSLGLYGRNLLNDRGYLDDNITIQYAARARPRTFGLKVGVAFN